MTHAQEQSTAQAESLKRQREIYAREGEAEFWDAAFCAALNGIIICGRRNKVSLIVEEGSIVADVSADTRRQARLQRWDEEHAPDLDAMMEAGASKEEIEAAITAATGRPANLRKGE